MFPYSHKAFFFFFSLWHYLGLQLEKSKRWTWKPFHLIPQVDRSPCSLLMWPGMMMYLMRVSLVFVSQAFLCSSARDKCTEHGQGEISLAQRLFFLLRSTYSTNMVLAFRSLQMPSLKLLAWHNKTWYVTGCENTLEQIAFSSSFFPKSKINEENFFQWKGWSVSKPIPNTHLFTALSWERWQWFSRSVSID